VCPHGRSSVNVLRLRLVERDARAGLTLVVNLVEAAKEDWSFGHVIARYAS
jgi:hypothetical protein